MEDEALEVICVLCVQRLVEAVVSLQVALDFGRHAPLRVEGTARRGVHQEEAAGDDDEQDRDRFEQAAGDELEHGASFSPVVPVIFPGGAPWPELRLQHVGFVATPAIFFSRQFVCLNRLGLRAQLGGQ